MRVKPLMRRDLTICYEFEGFRLEPARRRLLRDGEAVALTPETFDTLLVLIENRERVLEKEEALRLLWPNVHVEESSLAQNVFALRKVLGDSPEGARFIETVPRRGYRFIAPVRETTAASGGVNGRIYLRSTDGAPAVRLAEGFPGCLSPDGKWALVKRPGLTDFTVIPTGAGESRELAVPDLHTYRASWFPDGQRILWGAEVPGQPGRLWVQDLAGGSPQPITPERTGAGVVSPDGRLVATIGDDGHFLYPVNGGERRPLPGALPEEWPIQWGHDGKVYLARNDRLPVRVMRIDVATGQREVWREIAPPDRGGIVSVQPLITRDARAYVYTYNRYLSDLFLVRGVR